MLKVINKYSSIVKNINKHIERISLLKEKDMKQAVVEKINKPFMESDKNYIDYLRSLLKAMDVKDKDYIRVGEDADGGYILVDSFDSLEGILSIGIGYEVGFDKHFADKGIDVYMYDHTIDQIPVDHDKMHWKKIGVCGKSMKADNMQTLGEMVQEHKGKRMLLKMDVEGFEWDVLSGLAENELQVFDQITMELHGMLEYSLKDKIISSLENLNKTHQLVHVHANNAGTMLMFDNWVLPNLLEVTYVNKNNYQLIPNKRFFPTDKDNRNVSLFPEIQLGTYS